MAETKTKTKKATNVTTKQSKEDSVKKAQPKKPASTSKTTTSTVKKSASTKKASEASKTTKKTTVEKKTNTSVAEKKEAPKKSTTTKSKSTTKKSNTPVNEKKSTSVKADSKAKEKKNISTSSSIKTKTASASTKKKETNPSLKTKSTKTTTKAKTNSNVKQKNSSSKVKPEPVKTITSKGKIKGKEISQKRKYENIFDLLKKNGKAFVKKGQQVCSAFGKKASLGTKKLGSNLKKASSFSFGKLKSASQKLVRSINVGIKAIGSFLKEKKQNRKKEPILKKKQLLKENKQEEFSLTEKKEKKKRKPLRSFIILIFLVGIIAACLMIPYGATTYLSVDSNKLLDVPKFVKIKEECCNYSATFSTPRSVWSLQKDLDKIISSYEVLQCDGKQYYYNAKENYTITDYGIIDGTFLNQVYFTYGSGNSCDIDTKFKKLELLADDFSLNDAKKDGNYVIDGDKVYNQEAYEDFMENVKNKIPSTLRIVTTNADGDVLITDLEYLSSGKYMVSYDGTRDRNAKNHRSIIAYKFEHLKVSKNKLYAYNGELDTKSKKKYETYYLLTVPSE